MKKLIVFTDLDGTLLSHSDYSFEAALPALQLIKEKNIPLVICSSKTQKEIEHYRNRLCNLHPFVSENGGGIYIPEEYFEFNIQELRFKIEEKTGYKAIRLGAKYADLRRVLKELQAEGFNIKGFGDMSVDEISALTKLNSEEAEMAKEREFDEPFIFKGQEGGVTQVLVEIQKRGFNYTQGQFYHILGNSDKGKAVSILIDLFKKQYHEIVTVAFGDSPNDLPMLERVDYPVLVQKHNGEHDRQINIPGLLRADGIGPAGWNNSMIKFINRLI